MTHEAPAIMFSFQAVGKLKRRDNGEPLFLLLCEPFEGVFWKLNLTTCGLAWLPEGLSLGDGQIASPGPSHFLRLKMGNI